MLVDELVGEDRPYSEIAGTDRPYSEIAVTDCFEESGYSVAESGTVQKISELVHVGSVNVDVGKGVVRCRRWLWRSRTSAQVPHAIVVVTLAHGYFL